MSEEQTVRVRFAPSPTGYLHVGGARTAIFNWLFARQHDGKFLIRIEDTDTERSEEDLVEGILDGLSWLGLEADEDIAFQSRNLGHHRDAVNQLLEAGKAYRCFCTPEELEARRERAGDSEGAYQYDGNCRDLDADQVTSLQEAGDPFAVRFRTPERWINFKDLVYKKISVHSGEIDDFILQRRDGTPVYQLAVVVDDHAMNITHVIRGEDHLPNTPKQILLYQALGYPVPRFGHLPLILGGDGRRLSKRHGATSVTEFRARGYLYTALVNYLSLLGWSPRGNEEIFLPEELISQFDIYRVSRDSATFDEPKLRWVNGHHFSRWEARDLVPLVRPVLVKAGLLQQEAEDSGYLLEIVRLLQTRVQTLEEFVTEGRYFWEDPVEYESDAVERFWPDEEVNRRMEAWRDRLASLKEFDRDTLEQELRGFADDLGVKAADLIHPTRIAMTGRGASPGVFTVMELVGQERLIRRIGRALDYLP